MKTTVLKSLKSAAARVLVALVMLAVSASCAHRELCYDHEHWVDMRVDFDWSEAPDASPVTMVVWFFPDDEGSRAEDVNVRSYEFGGRDGGTVRLAAGTYRVVCFNGGTETLLERGSTWGDLRLTTDMQSVLAPMGGMMFTAPRPEVSRGEEVHQAPDRVWTDAIDRVTVSPGAEGQSVTLKPSETTLRLTVTVAKVTNFTRDLTFSGAASGLAEAVAVAQRASSGNGVTMPMPISMMPDSTLYGSINIFGHCPADPLKHILTIYTSNFCYFNFDVTERFHDALAQGLREIRIDIDSIEIPKKDPDDGTGLSPGVDGWDEVVDVFIEMD